MSVLCPFCGEGLNIYDSGHDDGSVSVDCPNCGMGGGHYKNRNWAKYVLTSRTDDSDFLPCPLCGKSVLPDGNGRRWYVNCMNCYIDMTSFVSREDLKEKWNRRTSYGKTNA